MWLDAAKRSSTAMLLLVIPFACAPALAQSERERSWCEGEGTVAPAQRIEACSSLIKAARDKGENLAELFNYRGVAFKLNGELDRAINDYSQAVKLNGKLAVAYNNRGVAY